jgi:carbamoyltransferase
MTAILGISAYYHDSAAALVVDGRIVAAAQEERFTRKKYDYEFPTKSIEFCLQQAGLSAGDLDYVGFYDKPFLKFERLLETYLAYAPAGFNSFRKAIPLWLRQKLHLPREMSRELKRQYQKRYVFTEHHESHAASAFYPSPFEEAAILTLDGVGEWATASWGYGRGNRIHLEQEMRFPHSLGLLYSAFTYYTGFTVNSGEYKLMGLAPYGEPKYVDLILEKLIDLKDDGSFRMDMSYFNYCQGLTMTSKKFEQLFGGPPRQPDSRLTRRDMDVAASIQKVTEEIMLRSARHVHAQTGMRKLCLAGGVALNCVANGRILREGPFDDIWIQPAAGDAGGALGVALFIWHQLLDQPRTPQPGDSQRGSLLGPTFSDRQIQQFLDSVGARYTRIDEDQPLCDHIADRIAAGNVIGWFQGPMEFGPRALGSRSLLGDPRDPQMQTVMNVKVKFREGFRPFAPAVLAERAHEYFGVEAGRESPYMLLVAPVREEKRCHLTPEDQKREGIDKLKTQRSVVPAITHVDYSARIQTVDPERHGLYHRVLDSFYKKTGCPVIVNTSFNLGWDPIVCTPQEAYSTFMASDIDVLCMGHFVLAKSAQRAFVPAEAAPRPDAQLADIWCSPNAQGELRVEQDHVVCAKSGQKFPITDGIPQMFWPHDTISATTDVTEIVKSFYEETPFPNYDDHDSVRSLIEKSRRGQYARVLDESIPYNSDVLEVGCGTGQLTNFLGISCRRVIGTDMCLNSLRLAEKFRREHGIRHVRFLQMNLFKPCFKPEQFDVVLCNGVLHHTADPRGGFEIIQRLVRPGGYIVIGLYNTYGRLMTDLRRNIFRVTGGRGKWLDAYLRSRFVTPDKRRAWFNDQYRHPHESKHTIDEVLEWFDRVGLEFVRGVPSVTANGEGLARGNLFHPTAKGTQIDHFLVQSREIVTGSREGGFFIMIGRKPSHVAAPSFAAGANGEGTGPASREGLVPSHDHRDLATAR